ncbi:hypothetical protein [Gilliamella apicola]|uniref:hypothetical protein n=1 Tax=Gilliamella apicola TaxID=1196095 RepID=UPI002FEE222D
MRFSVLSVRARIPKKEVLLSFGSYFVVSLQQARNLLNKAQGLIRQSIEIQEYKAE